MNGHDEHRALIPAYHAGQLSQEEADAIRRRCADDAAFAADVEALAPVADWLRRGLANGPSSNYRLSADRVATIRAAARGDIVSFPQRPAAPVRKRTRVVRATRRYGLATAAALAMMVGAVSGFESGRFQFIEPAPAQIAIVVDSLDVHADTVRYASEDRSYVPGYGLDHADLHAMAHRNVVLSSRPSYTVAATFDRTLGLPGPVSPYLQAKDILPLQ